MKKIFAILKKLKPLDYLIILIVLLGILFLSRYARPEEEWVDVLVVDDRLPVLLASSFKVDDIEKNLSGQEISKITSVQSFNSPGTSGSIQDVFLEVKLFAKVNPRTKQFEFKNRELTPGAAIELNFPTGTARGIILSMGDILKNRKPLTKILTLKIYSNWPWLAESIKVGDALLDKEGNKVVEVLEKNVVPTVFTNLALEQAQFLQVNPDKVDITLKVRTQIYDVNGELVAWNTKKVAVGEVLDFSTENTAIKEAVITEIND